MVELAAVSHASTLPPVHLWDHYVAYTLDEKKAIVCDLATGSVATVAEAEEGTTVERPLGSRELVVWSAYSQVPRMDMPGLDWSLWTIEAVDLRTGIRWTLDRSKAAGRGVDTRFARLPFPDVEWPWVTWLHPVDDDNADLWSFDVRTGKAIVIATLPNGGDVSMSDGRVVYDHVTSSDFKRRDLYVVPADGSGKPKRLLEFPLGQAPEVTGEWVAWFHRVAPAAPPATLARYDTWLYSLKRGGDPVRLGPGSIAQPGRDFVLVEHNEALALYDPHRPGEPSVELISRDRLVPFLSWALVRDDLLSWTVTNVDTEESTLRVFRITRRAA